MEQELIEQKMKTHLKEDERTLIKALKDVKLRLINLRKKEEKILKKQKREKKENTQIRNHLLGNDVKYGDEIFIMHYDSKKYMKGK